MSSTQYVYSKQQFISDVSFNSALTVAGAATFTGANTIINGNVGIGTTSPASKLHINGSSVASGTNISRIIQGNGSYNSVTDAFQDPFTITSVDASNISIGMGVDTTNKIGYINVAQSGSVRHLYLNCRENAPVVALGNVGIGTTNPVQKLDIQAGAAASPEILLRPNNGSDAYWGIQAKTGNGGLLIGTTDGNGTITGNQLSILNSGNVGIGTTAPGYPLHIRNGANKYVQFGAHYYISSIGYNSVGTQYDWNTGFINIYTGLYVQDGGIYTDWGVNALVLYAFSDERIKTNIVDIDDGNALSILRQIQPKTYDYVDKIHRGNANVIGFIAQEVKAILPNAVSITKDYIPNFMTLCQVSATDETNIVLVTSPIDLSWNPLHDACGNAFVDADGNACSDASGNKIFKVKLYDQSNNLINCKTTSILDKRSFLMDVTDSKMVDASGNLVLEADGGYFLHGQEVDDFHNLDKQAIFTVVTAAVQDMDRKQQADEVQIQAQEAKIAQLESKNAALEALVAEQQAQINAILAKIGGV